MKVFLRKIFNPILNIFEKGDGPYVYKSMNRKILIAVGLMFASIAAIVILYILHNNAYGYFLPALVFSVVAIVSLVVGTLGNERAVAKIWGNK